MSQTRARGLPERVPWEGLAPWPGLGRSPAVLPGPQKKPAVPQSWRSQYAELGELVDLGE